MQYVFYLFPKKQDNGTSKGDLTLKLSDCFSIFLNSGGQVTVVAFSWCRVGVWQQCISRLRTSYSGS